MPRVLRKLINEKALVSGKGRITNIKPWTKGVLVRAYKRTASENWDRVEEAAARSQRPISFDD